MNESAINILKAWMGDAGQTLAALLNQEVEAGDPEASSVLSASEVNAHLPSGFCLPVTLSGMVSGPMVMGFSDEHARILAGMMLGEVTTPEELSQLHLDVLTEALGQFASILPEVFRSTLQLGTVSVIEGTTSQGNMPQLGASDYYLVRIPLLTEDNNYTLFILMPSRLGQDLSELTTLSPSTSPTPHTLQSSPSVSQASFAPLNHTPNAPSATERGDLDLILDVPMQLTAVLGTTSISMEELINLGTGSVLELDKLAGEPVELFVHGRQVAVGEVVVVDERFGVKILRMVGGRGQVRESGLRQVV